MAFKLTEKSSNSLSNEGRKQQRRNDKLSRKKDDQFAHCIIEVMDVWKIAYG